MSRTVRPASSEPLLLRASATGSGETLLDCPAHPFEINTTLPALTLEPGQRVLDIGTAEQTGRDFAISQFTY
jgi:hypothetical protein